MVSPERNDEGGNDEAETPADVEKPEALGNVPAGDGPARHESQASLPQREASALDEIVESLIDKAAMQSIRKSQHETYVVPFSNLPTGLGGS
jgi:hypothetical protein